MFNWWHWLFATEPFRSPATGLGLTPGLVWATVSSCLLTFLVCTAIMILLLEFIRKKTIPRYFYDQTTALAFAALLGVLGANALIRALMFAWPAYRFQAASAGLAALVAFGAAAVMIPVAMQRRVKTLSDERHAFANKVHTESLQLTTNLIRTQQLQEEMIKLIAALRLEQSGEGEP